MHYEEFIVSLKNSEPPQDLSKPGQAMWWDAKGHWDKAHAIAQDDPDLNGSWIHAYLHRKEGDNGNAGYWYNRAGRDFPLINIDEEAREIIIHILSINN